MPPPSGRHVNTKDFKLQPASGQALLLKNVQNVGYDTNSQSITGSGDFDIYPTAKTLVFNDPQVTVDTEDKAGCIAMHGRKGTVSWKSLDSENLDTVASGGLLYTIDNAKAINMTEGNRHKTFSTAALKIECHSDDGVTSPVVITAL